MKYQALKRVLEMLPRAPMVLQVIRLPRTQLKGTDSCPHPFFRSHAFISHSLCVGQDKYYLAPPFEELRAYGKDRQTSL